MRRRDSAIHTTEVLKSHSLADMNGHNGGLSIQVLGVCTGAGLQSLRCALLQYHQDGPNKPLRGELIRYSDIVIPSPKRLLIFNTLRDAQFKASSTPRFNILLGHMFSDGIEEFCKQSSISIQSIDLVGTHTPLALQRARNLSAEVSIVHPSGWNTIVAAETGINTVFDFTIAENATVRSHLPPTAFFDKLVLRHPTKFRACLNIGELATLSFIPPSGDAIPRSTMARECGPGSLLIDYAMRYCSSNVRVEDHDGKCAEPGQVNHDIVRRFLSAHDYERTQPPLVIAREMFGDHEAQGLIDECLFENLSEADTIATITRVTAQNTVNQFRKLLAKFFPQGQTVDELFICGPSARNANIVDFLEAELPESVITRPLEDIGIPGDANDSIAFAHLAFEAVLCQATQSAPPPARTPHLQSIDSVRAMIIRGHSWDTILQKIQVFSEGQQLHVTHDVRIKEKSKSMASTG
ncbi:hypothetical protein ACN47E_001379 [Coniothyrium glycines]